MLTDKDIVVEFLKLTGFPVEELNGFLVADSEGAPQTDKFTHMSYDNIEMLFMFDDKGNMIRGCIDSHVTFADASDNYKIIIEKMRG